MSGNNSINNISAQDLVALLKSAKIKLIAKKKIIDKKDKHVYPISEPPFNIPANWRWCYLSDVSIIQEGPGIRKHQYQDEGIQFITVTNILEGSIDLDKSKKYISLDEYNQKYAHYTINKGDILTACSGATWGKSAIYNLNEKIILNTSTLRLRFFNDLSLNKYLYYLTKTDFFKNYLSSHSTGQQDNYGYSHYSTIPIPIPSLKEQKQIVAILDKAFAAIDRAKANVERNLNNAKELFQSKLNAIFSQQGEGWEERKIDEISNVINGFSFKSKDFSNTNTIKSIKITNVGVKEFVEDDGNKLPESFSKKYKDVQVKNGDLVLALTRTIISSGLKVAIVPDNYYGALLNQRVAAIVPNNRVIESDFLYYYFCSKYVTEYVLAHVNTLMQPNLSIKDLKRMPVPLPPLPRQKVIIEIIDSISANTERLTKIYRNKLVYLEELKKSILQKAFGGSCLHRATNPGGEPRQDFQD